MFWHSLWYEIWLQMSGITNSSCLSHFLKVKPFGKCQLLECYYEITCLPAKFQGRLGSKLCSVCVCVCRLGVVVLWRKKARIRAFFKKHRNSSSLICIWDNIMVVAWKQVRGSQIMKRTLMPQWTELNFKTIRKNGGNQISLHYSLLENVLGKKPLHLIFMSPYHIFFKGLLRGSINWPLKEFGEIEW